MRKVVITVVSFVVLLGTAALPWTAISQDRDRQATTVFNVLELGKGVERYRTDRPRIGPPRVDNAEELMQIFKENGINLNPGANKDGWDNLIHYSWSGTGYTSWSYTVMSYGSDGEPGPDVAPDASGRRIVTRYVEDIIWNNGVWYQRPEGAQRRR